MPKAYGSRIKGAICTCVNHVGECKFIVEEKMESIALTPLVEPTTSKRKCSVSFFYKKIDDKNVMRLLTKREESPHVSQGL